MTKSNALQKPKLRSAERRAANKVSRHKKSKRRKSGSRKTGRRKTPGQHKRLGGGAIYLYEECPLCLDQIIENDQVIIRPYMCAHIFHRACIDFNQASQALCPFCRAPFKPCAIRNLAVIPVAAPVAVPVAAPVAVPVAVPLPNLQDELFELQFDDWLRRNNVPENQAIARTHRRLRRDFLNQQRRAFGQHE
jgi:hypothetical protein